MFRIQVLADKNRDYEPAAARHSIRGNVWLDICPAVSRISVAERILKNFKTDNANAFVRIRPIEVSRARAKHLATAHPSATQRARFIASTRVSQQLEHGRDILRRRNTLYLAERGIVL
jgi:hypothetical protein